MECVSRKENRTKERACLASKPHFAFDVSRGRWKRIKKKVYRGCAIRRHLLLFRPDSFLFFLERCNFFLSITLSFFHFTSSSSLIHPYIGLPYNNLTVSLQQPKQTTRKQIMSTFGTHFRVTTFGESHCKGVGCIIDGCPPGLALTEDDIQPQLTRRRPGQSNLTTPVRASFVFIVHMPVGHFSLCLLSCA